MTRLEVDIDTSHDGTNPTVSTDIRIVRECTTPYHDAELETRLARVLRTAIIDILKSVPHKKA